MVPVLVLVTSPFCRKMPSLTPEMLPELVTRPVEKKAIPALRAPVAEIVPELFTVPTLTPEMPDSPVPAPVIVPKLLTVPRVLNRSPESVPATEAPERIL
jgi:hypothetical protein